MYLQTSKKCTINYVLCCITLITKMNKQYTCIAYAQYDHFKYKCGSDSSKILYASFLFFFFFSEKNYAYIVEMMHIPLQSYFSTSRQLLTR